LSDSHDNITLLWNQFSVLASFVHLCPEYLKELLTEKDLFWLMILEMLGISA
jgi:hypothetical protein